MFPEINIITDTETLPAETKRMGKVFLFDFQTGKHVLKDGKPVEASYEEAIKQWIMMLLTTEIDEYAVYKGSDFGLRTKHYIGNRIPIGTVSSDYKQQIEDKILLHPEILSIDNFAMERTDNRVIVSFSVVTAQGNIAMNESEVRISG
ncbi:Protein of unknown function [Paenibacillaceae bacterium GAS479]|nr:Protein of unknown function [Paenibacillaceae bacterium GAS479]